MWHCNKEGSRPGLLRLCGAVIFTTADEEKDKCVVGAKWGKTIYIGNRRAHSQATRTNVVLRAQSQGSTVNFE
jgi:hypothetical protein